MEAIWANHFEQILFRFDWVYNSTCINFERKDIILCVFQNGYSWTIWVWTVAVQSILLSFLFISNKKRVSEPIVIHINKYLYYKLILFDFIIIIILFGATSSWTIRIFNHAIHIYKGERKIMYGHVRDGVYLCNLYKVQCVCVY